MNRTIRNSKIEGKKKKKIKMKLHSFLLQEGYLENDEENRVAKLQEAIPKTVKTSAIMRLMRDFKEIQHTIHEIPYIAAKPLPSNMYEWHINMIARPRSPYFGGVFHMTLTFDNNYPRTPPSFSLKTTVARNHVYGEWLCLDIFDRSESKTPYRGWSQAYTVTSILVSIYAFLWDNYILSRVNRCVRVTKTFKCSCGHDMSLNNIFPSNPVFEKHYMKMVGSSKLEMTQNNKSCKNKHTKNLINILPDDILRTVFSYIWPHERILLQKVDKRWKKIMINMTRDSITSNMSCYYSKLRYDQSVIGIGCNSYYNPYNAELAYVSSPLEMMSWDAFHQNNVRVSIWNTDTVTHFMPLFLNVSHSKKALPLFKLLICQLYRLEVYDHLKAVDFLCKLMNTQVVNVMNGELSASSNAVQGYTQCHRWLIYIYESSKMAQYYIDEKVAAMMGDNIKRKSLEAIPSIGDFLSLLSVSKYKWKDVAPYVLSEQWDRNIKWACRYNPDLYLENCSNDARIKSSWASSKVASGLILFHDCFLQLFRPDDCTLNETAEFYDEHLGVPSSIYIDRFIDNVKQIHHVSKYNEFFYRLGMLPIMKLSSILKHSYQNALLKGYHSVSNYPSDIEMYKRNISKSSSSSSPNWSPWSREKVYRSPFERVVPRFQMNHSKPKLISYSPSNSSQLYFIRDDSVCIKYDAIWNQKAKKLSKRSYPLIRIKKIDTSNYFYDDEL